MVRVTRSIVFCVVFYRSLFDLLAIVLSVLLRGPGWLNELGSWITYQLIQAYHKYGFVIYKKGYTRLAVASDQVYQLLAHGRWFSPSTPASSATNTGRHDIAEILLKVALNTKSLKFLLLLSNKYVRSILYKHIKGSVIIYLQGGGGGGGAANFFE